MATTSAKYDLLSKVKSFLICVFQSRGKSTLFPMIIENLLASLTGGQSKIGPINWSGIYTQSTTDLPTNENKVDWFQETAREKPAEYR